MIFLIIFASFCLLLADLVGYCESVPLKATNVDSDSDFVQEDRKSAELFFLPTSMFSFGANPLQGFYETESLIKPLQWQKWQSDIILI